MSIDITEIYHEKFNFIRYLMCWFHFLLINISLFVVILSISHELFYDLIDNEFLSKNFKIIILYLILICIMTISYRFDALLAQSNGSI